MTTTDTDNERHPFTGDDPAGPCMHMDGVGAECGMGAAAIVHAISAVASEESAQDEPQRGDPADRLLSALAPDNVPEFEDGEAEDALSALTVEDLDGASWAAGRLHRAQRKVAELATLAADQHARINDWLEAETARLARDVAFFEGRLQGFHEYALRADPKRAKTINLPNGTALASQAGKLAVEVVDLAALIEYAETLGIAEEILDYPDPKPKKVAISAKFASKAEDETEPGSYAAFDRESGVEVPGVEIVRKPRTFSIRPPAGDDQ